MQSRRIFPPRRIRPVAPRLCDPALKTLNRRLSSPSTQTKMTTTYRRTVKMTREWLDNILRIYKIYVSKKSEPEPMRAEMFVLILRTYAPSHPVPCTGHGSLQVYYCTLTSKPRAGKHNYLCIYLGCSKSHPLDVLPTHFAIETIFDEPLTNVTIWLSTEIRSGMMYTSFCSCNGLLASSGPLNVSERLWPNSMSAVFDKGQILI